MARPLGGVQRLLVAAPQYLELAQPMEQPPDLEFHACLVYSQKGGPAEWPLRGAPPFHTNGFCRINNSVMLRNLLLAGIGLTLPPDFVVGGLVTSSPQWPARSFGQVSHRAVDDVVGDSVAVVVCLVSQLVARQRAL